MDLVTVSRLFNPAEADLLAARLSAAGFDVHVHGDGAALSLEGYSMATGGIRVKVPADQEARVREFLDADDDPPPAV
jgi:hypothetical protein